MIDEKIKELGYTVPVAPKPLAAYIPVIKTDKLVFTAGQLPMVGGKLIAEGKLGAEVSNEVGTKAAEICALNCLSVIKSEIRSKVINHIKENAQAKNIWLEAVNGYSDHLHCLISLKREETISKVAQLIKGESSNWINKQNLIKTKFLWQDDYWAVSVSESDRKRLKEYIRNQKEHHKLKQFDAELENIIL